MLRSWLWPKCSPPANSTRTQEPTTSRGQAPAKTKARAIGQLESLGYQVIPEPLQQTG
ncbi:UNVERIFIED_ORG: hypothetical protein ABID57_000470 [Arthrobacter sp. UYEF1]